MEKDKIIIFTALLLGFIVLWFIFYSSRPVVEEPKEEDVKENEEDYAPWRRETRDLGNGYDYEYDFEFEFENEFQNDYDLNDHGIDFDYDFSPPKEESKKEPKVESRNSDLIQKKVNDCLTSENQRYRDVLNIFLDKDSFFYVGDDDYLEYQKHYQEDHERRKSECYQLYLSQ